MIVISLYLPFFYKFLIKNLDSINNFPVKYKISFPLNTKGGNNL